MKKSDFTYENDRHVLQTIEIDDSDLKFVQNDTKIKDTVLKTKPTTFFKDAFRRFRKNKSSVVGGIILGVLLLFAFLLPLTLPADITDVSPSETMLRPKLFNTGTGFWDGTERIDNITYDPVTKLPDPDSYDSRGVSDITTTKKGENFTDAVNKYAYGGYMRLWMNQSDTESVGSLYSDSFNIYLTNEHHLVIKFANTGESGDFTLGEFQVYLSYMDYNPETFLYDIPKTIVIQDYSTDYSNLDLDFNALLTSKGFSGSYLAGAQLGFHLKSSPDGMKNLLVEKVIIDSSDETENEKLAKISCEDANASLSISNDGENVGFWTSLNSTVNLYHANIRFCSFTYDEYEVVYGEKDNFKFGGSLIDKYVSRGWMNIDLDTYMSKENPTAEDLSNLIDSFEILDDTYCPVRTVENFSVSHVMGVTTYSIVGKVSLYRYMDKGYTRPPRYLFGSDASGKDLLKVTFSGLRTSLILGIITFVVCFTFGLIWGSVSGYFGGTTDIVMERFKEVLGGVPWIVVMTLCIINLGTSFQVFVLALCLTGWMSTAGITRTQFYRFKRREYVLAARTLGASDGRLIYRHILPNAMGTIITSSVLMIPAVIFSEATLAYLNLGLQGLDSFGVTLSENQKFISSYPMLIAFPSVIMALLMISFNLFGNGLRDAFNPSLKGSD
ncbi:MAG: ABC transporter permease [Bacilli bacterium]|nr:ABC transporter permease [Bacilli bacterium]